MLCRHEGVEQELPVLTAGIAFADEWVAGQHVVAVDDLSARERVVVETEQDDGLVRHRAHGRERADTDGPVAEVAARAARTPALLQHDAHIGDAKRGTRCGAGFEERQFAFELGALPGHVTSGCSDGEHVAPQPREPLLGSEARPRQSGVDGAHAADLPRRFAHLREEGDEGLGDGDVGASEIVDRDELRRRRVRVSAHGDAQGQPVEGLRPGVVLEAAEAVLAAMLGIETPASLRRADPPGDAFERVGVEAELLGHRGEPREVEHLRGGDAARHEFDETLRGFGQRVGGRNGAVRQLHA